MLTPLVFFLLSFVGLCVLFAVKFAELSTGRVTFLSHWSSKLDPWFSERVHSIQAFLAFFRSHTLLAFFRVCMVWISSHIAAFFALGKPFFRKIQRVLHGSKKDIDVTKNPASFFLKHMSEHKNGLKEGEKTE